MKRRELLLALSVGTLGTRAVRAQQKTMPVIGYLGCTSPDLYAPVVTAFHQGLTETGYVEHKNLAVESRWAEGDYNRLPGLAADLVRRNVEVIATVGNPATIAAKGSTSTIPIVFGIGGDPIELGLVNSLARPRGNLTGVTIINVELIPKRFELISELVPQARVIALLVNPSNPGSERIIRDVQEAARARGLDLKILKAGTESDIDTVFASFVQLQPGALIVGSDQYFFSRREQLVALASRYAVPAIYQWREFPAAGGLISYGSSLTGAWRPAGAMSAAFSREPSPLICRCSSRPPSSLSSTSRRPQRSASPSRPRSLPAPTRSSNEAASRTPASADTSATSVSPRVWNVKNNDPSLMEPVAA
jgi:putative tryptophan/tyrosine transport system substrate-binding protein